MSTAHLIARNLIFGVPGAVIEGAANLAYSGVGVAASLISAVTCGKFKSINDWAECTSHSTRILAPLHLSFVEVLAPRSREGYGGNVNYEHGKISAKLLADFTVNYLIPCGNSENAFVREVGTRLCFGVKAVATVVTKLADLALGLVAAAISIVPLAARSHTVNRFAQQQLQATDVIHSLCRCIRGIFNPSVVYVSFQRA